MSVWDLVPANPGTHRILWRSRETDHSLYAGGFDDVRMSAHALNVPFAHNPVKCLLHTMADYAWPMSASERLKIARERAGYATAADAALALDISRFTYAQHENGTRGFKKDSADQYARKFKVSVEWLLYGRGAADQPDSVPSEDVLEQMVREAIEAEVTVDTKLSDLPRILGSNLREQLKHYEADPKVARFWDEKLARDATARSHAPTKRGAGAKPRSA